MSGRTLISLLGAAAFAGAVATAAHAEPAKGKAIDFTVRNDTSAATGSKSLKWDTRKGRWGVSLNLDQPADRDAQWGDLQAGAYFRITPSLRVGGAVALGEKETPAFKKTEPQEGAPRVRLETAFKF
jgi:hypothetical protein